MAMLNWTRNAPLLDLLFQANLSVVMNARGVSNEGGGGESLAQYSLSQWHDYYPQSLAALLLLYGQRKIHRYISRKIDSWMDGWLTETVE